MGLNSKLNIYSGLPRSTITHRGRFNAFINMIIGTGNAISPYFFGKFITTYGLFELWILCSSLTFASGFFMLWLRYYERSREYNN